jgi:lipopolysaccharide transport system permease protein
VVANANYVKKVVFPLEILPVVSVLAALFHLLIAYVILLGLILASHWTMGATALLAPLVLLPYVLLILGLCWAIGALGVYLRDVGQIIGVLITVLMFLTPIFYPASALPAAYQPLMFMNPLTAPIEMARDLMYWGKLPSLSLLAVYGAGALGFALLGFAWFQKTRKGFADVL